MAAIRAEQLSKRYGDTLAVDALDLDVREGEVYGYLGPNGAGKTTTISTQRSQNGSASLTASPTTRRWCCSTARRMTC